MTLGESLSLSEPLFPHFLGGANNRHLKAVPVQGMKLAQGPAEWAPRTISLMLFCPLVRTSPSKSPPPPPHSSLGNSTSSKKHSLQEPHSWYVPQPETHLLPPPPPVFNSCVPVDTPALGVSSDQGSTASFPSSPSPLLGQGTQNSAQI